MKATLISVIIEESGKETCDHLLENWLSNLASFVFWVQLQEGNVDWLYDIVDNY